MPAQWKQTLSRIIVREGIQTVLPGALIGAISYYYLGPSKDLMDLVFRIAGPGLAFVATATVFIYTLFKKELEAEVGATEARPKEAAQLAASYFRRAMSLLYLLGRITFLLLFSMLFGAPAFLRSDSVLQGAAAGLVSLSQALAITAFLLLMTNIGYFILYLVRYLHEEISLLLPWIGKVPPESSTSQSPVELVSGQMDAVKTKLDVLKIKYITDQITITEYQTQKSTLQAKVEELKTKVKIAVDD